MNWIEKERANGFANLRGSVIAGSIPLRDTVINEFAQAALIDPSTGIKQVRITVQEFNRVRIQLQIEKWFLTLNPDLELEIDQNVLMASSPLLKIKVTQGGGFMLRVIELLIPLLGLVPESITMVNQLITINLKVAFERHGYGDLAPFVQLIHFSTEAGLLRVDFLLKAL